MPSQTKLAAFIVFSVLVGFGSAAPPSTKPVDGLRDNTPKDYALTGARCVVSPGRVIEHAVIVIRNGAIVAVGADVDVPKDVRTVDLTGKTVYPGFIDAFSEADVDPEILKNGAPHWNSLIHPQLRVADQYKADSSLNKKFRSQGIAARLVAPKNGVLKGTSAVVTTGDDDNSQSIIKADVAMHIRLTVPRGRGRDNYPNSPMGAVALARQTMYDADWYRRAWTAYRGNNSLATPERNDALTALSDWRESDGLVVIDSLNELYALRADLFAREFALRIVLLGSGNEYRRLDAIRATGRAVIVPVNFPKPPNVATLEAAMNATLEQMMDWDIAPENPARLSRAGVKIALTSHGLKDTGSFLANVRKAVERGLPPEAALAALTTAPAELLGINDRLGSIEVGKLANLVVTDGDLFASKTKVLETWVRGKRFQIKEPALLDLTGIWKLDLAKPVGKTSLIVLEIRGSGEKLSGTIRSSKSKPDDATTLSRLASRDARFSTTFEGKLLHLDGIVQLSGLVEQRTAKTASMLGVLVLPDGRQVEFVANRESKQPTEKKDAAKKEVEKPKSRVASSAVNFPLGAFGRTSPPDQPRTVLFRNATIWTCGKQGVLRGASLLIGDGKILAVGRDLKAPPGAKVIDCQNRHITPGIIDCHSHMATDGGINEGTQAVTAEVRIGDFINADDVTIYRHLAGGVTCANILHGSANPIGGQNQVIKLRWGALPEEMKFAEAPAGIKFALGENVKQSNWGDKYTKRYPQTRMGVVELMRDEFETARSYQRRWHEWRKSHQGLPPRRDLELDAISEILNGERWIHCHSYRQDEILALIRTLDHFGIRIGSFQHILEGYKVADAMAKHGATGSAFSDWWAYKFEVYDAIPFNGALMHHAGVNVSFNSDDRELARHLNQEAAKAIKYGGVEPTEALKFVTLNPAIQLRIDKYVGSLEVGKHADVVVWNGPPLSNLSLCEQTWVDGRKYFDRAEDIKQRKQSSTLRATLIQKILASGQPMQKPGERKKDPSELWPREDIFCGRHTHGK